VLAHTLRLFIQFDVLLFFSSSDRYDMYKFNELSGLGYIVCLNSALGLICITQQCPNAGRHPLYVTYYSAL